ncbi:MAG: hypothetical protein KDD66_04430 [Bdellovibrionales bacterium]|nr:hypothetical protein [Bdellovibrionales bacterium]
MTAPLKIAVYWRGSNSPLTEVLQLLTEQKFRIREASTVSDVVSLLVRYNKPLIVADGSASEAEENARLLELSSIDDAKKCPAVLLGASASSKADQLASCVEAFAAIDFPCEPANAGKIINSIWSSVHAAELPLVMGRPGGRKGISRKRVEHSIPLNNEQKQLVSEAGNVLAGAAISQQRPIEEFIPNHPYKPFILDAVKRMDQEDEWIGGHGKRTSAVSSVASTITVGDESRLENIQLSSMLLNVSTITNGSPCAHVDLTRVSADRDEKQKLAALYRASAEFVRQELKDDRVSRTINAVSSLLLGQPVDEKFAIVNDAQCILGAEFVDRGCWADGVWNPRGANRVIRNLRSSQPIVNDDILLGVFTKIVGEAVIANPRITNTQFTNRKILEQALTLPKIGDGETYVDVSDLAPGMKLSQPIKTLDGLIVVPGNLTLDSDLIRRLWQLAGVRAVGTKVAVITDSI